MAIGGVFQEKVESNTVAHLSYTSWRLRLVVRAKGAVFVQVLTLFKLHAKVVPAVECVRAMCSLLKYIGVWRVVMTD